MSRVTPMLPRLDRGHPLVDRLGMLAVPVPGLVGGSHLRDLVNRHPGERKGAAPWVNTPEGPAIVLDGSSGWIDFGNVLNPGTADFSIALRFRAAADFTTNSTSGGRLIQNRGTGPSGTPGYTINVFRTGSNELNITNSSFDDGTNSVPLWGGVKIGLVGEWVTFVGTFHRAGLATGYFYSPSLGLTRPLTDISARTDLLGNDRSMTIGASDTTNTQFAAITTRGAAFWLGRVLSADEAYEVHNGFQRGFPGLLYRPTLRTTFLLAASEEPPPPVPQFSGTAIGTASGAFAAYPVPQFSGLASGLGFGLASAYPVPQFSGLSSGVASGEAAAYPVPQFSGTAFGFASGSLTVVEPEPGLTPGLLDPGLIPITLSWSEPTGGEPPYTAQAERSTDGGQTWTEIDGATESPASVGFRFGDQFRVRFEDSAEPPNIAHSNVEIMAGGAAPVPEFRVHLF